MNVVAGEVGRTWLVFVMDVVKALLVVYFRSRLLSVGPWIDVVMGMDELIEEDTLLGMDTDIGTCCLSELCYLILLKKSGEVNRLS